MPAADARPVPRKNAAFRFYFTIRNSTSGALITSWTGADSEVSLDGAGFVDCANEAVEIGTSGCGYIDLTASEMNADSVVYKLTLTNSNALTLVVTFYPEESGDYRCEVVSFLANSLTAAAIAANAFNGKGDWLTSLGANAPAGWLNAAAIAAAALNGKGDWNIGKTGYALSSASIDAIDAALLNAGDATDLIASIVARIGNTNVDEAALVVAIKAALFDSSSVTNKLNVDASGKVLLQPSQPGVTIPTVTNVTNSVNISSTAVDNIWARSKNSMTAGSIGEVVNDTNSAVNSYGLLITTALAVLQTTFDGITSLAKWLGLLAGKGADAPTLAEIRATPGGANYDQTTMSLQALPDSVLDSVVESGLTVRQCIRLANSVLHGNATGMTDTPVFKSLDGTKNRVTGTITGDNRSISARDAT